MSLSIIIPCYNEEEIIEKVVRSYYNQVIDKIRGAEIIVVNDCSTDRTAQILKDLKKKLPRLKVLKPPVNGGHGKAIRLGYEAAQKKYVFQVDGDNQFKPQDFWKLYQFKDDYDFILGARQNRSDPLYRLVLTRIIRFTNLFLFGVWIKDANCPFRLIKKEVLIDLLKPIDPEALAPNIKLAIIAKKKKFKIKEVPVFHRPRKTGKISIVSWKLIRFSLKGLTQLLELRKKISGGK